MREILLDLREITLLGWEDTKSRSRVRSILWGIEAGDQFPPVKVIQRNEGTYVINCDSEGGHHRAIAHYIAGVPLRCELVDRPELMDCTWPVSEITIGKIIGGDHVFDGYRIKSSKPDTVLIF